MNAMRKTTTNYDDDGARQQQQQQQHNLKQTDNAEREKKPLKYSRLQ